MRRKECAFEVGGACAGRCENEKLRMLMYLPMPITFELVDGSVRAVATGAIHKKDVLDHLHDERNQGGLAFGEIIDARQAKAKLSYSDVQEIREMLRTIAKEHRLGPTAVVVGSDLDYGIMRMYQTIVEEVATVMPFRDFDSAEHWLRSLNAR